MPSLELQWDEQWAARSVRLELQWAMQSGLLSGQRSGLLLGWRSVPWLVTLLGQQMEPLWDFQSDSPRAERLGLQRGLLSGLQWVDASGIQRATVMATKWVTRSGPKWLDSVSEKVWD